MQENKMGCFCQLRCIICSCIKCYHAASPRRPHYALRRLRLYVCPSVPCPQ